MLTERVFAVFKLKFKMYDIKIKYCISNFTHLYDIYTQSCRCEIRTFTDRGISLAQSHIMVPFPLRGYQVPLLGPRRSRMEY